MSADPSAGDRPEPVSEEAGGQPPVAQSRDQGASSHRAEVAVPLVAAEVLRPFELLLQPTQPTFPNIANVGAGQLAAQQALAQVAQDITRIGHDAANAPFAQLAQDLARQQRKIAEFWADTSAAISGPTSMAATLTRIQRQQAEWSRQMASSVKQAVDGFWPWIKKTAKTAGEKAEAFYRRVAPPNWTSDDASTVDYFRAVRLSMEEGIPLA